MLGLLCSFGIFILITFYSDSRLSSAKGKPLQTQTASLCLHESEAVPISEIVRLRKLFLLAGIDNHCEDRRHLKSNAINVDTLLVRTAESMIIFAVRPDSNV